MIALRKILMCIIAVTLCFCAVFSTLHGVIAVNAVNYSLQFDETNVLDDLRSSTVNGKPFDIREYSFNTSGNSKAQIISFIEYCYSPYANMQGNYGLYLYIYNPQGLTINTASIANKVQMAVAYNADGTPKDYDKFDLRFCSVSTEPNYYKLFYKFRILDRKSNDGKTVLQRVNSNERRYDISGFELHEQGKTNAVEYTVGGTYKFTGYVKGYGADATADSTLSCSVGELETIELEVKDTFFRPDIASGKGANYRNQLNSVYFSVDERFFEMYGKLQKIKAEWYEYKTAPILVTNDANVYNSMIDYRGKKFTASSPFGWFGRSIPYGFAFDKFSNMSGIYYNWNYNHYTIPNYGEPYAYTPAVDSFYYLFYTSNKDINDYVISADELSGYIYDYNKSAHKGYLPVKDKTISADLFDNNVDAGRTYGYNPNMEFDTDDKFDLLFYDDNNNSGWQRFWDFFGKWGIETGGDFYGKSPIIEVVDSDVSGNDDTVSNKLLIDKGDVKAFKDFYSAEKKKNKRVVLFRFAQTDYMSQELFIPKGSGIEGNKKGYAAQETVFFDFDIIQLTFNRDGFYRVIPVVSSPIDIINSIVPPLSDAGSSWWLLILIVLIVIILLIVISPLVNVISLLITLIKWLLKALAWLLKGIFKILIAPFKGIKKLMDKKSRG